MLELGEELPLTGMDIGFAIEGGAEISYGQMSVSIYGNLWGYDAVGVGMPAAYLWDRGREAAILFDPGRMTWMKRGVYTLPQNGSVDVAKREGADVIGICYGFDHRGNPIRSGTLAAGETMRVDFSLRAGLAGKRSGVAAISRKAELLAPLHPTMVTEPPAVREDLKASVTLSWESFADGTATALLHPLAYNEVVMRLRDPILSSEKRASRYYVGCPRRSEDRYASSDFSCNNDWLSSMAAYNRIRQRGDVAAVVSAKMDALQFFYDPQANMIRHGFRAGNLVGPYEMPWQNFFFHTETYRASMLSDRADYSPAAMANLLSSVEGLTELVQKCDYVLPQWIDPITKTAETQQDVPALGVVYEPWQIGSYAYLLVKAYDITGLRRLLELASEALTEVIEEVRFTVSNEIYTKEYTDSAGFPITELAGTANGTYAAYRLFELTGEAKYLSYSEAFFGMLSQLTFWYDDNLIEAAEGGSILGLFEPHGGASLACPWETIEALLPLTEILDATGDYRFNDLMLALFNCQRISSFSFYPVTWWEEHFGNQAAFDDADFHYIPTEPLYHSFTGGNSDYGALYMSSISFRNYLMYEAFGGCDNPDVMVLCTDVQGSFEAAFRGAERSFILYNPTSREVTVRFKQKELPDGSYTVTGLVEKTSYTAEELRAGVQVSVPARTGLRIGSVSDDTTRLAEARQDVLTRYRMAAAYHAVVESVQEYAGEILTDLFPDAGEEELRTACEYVLTYVEYEEAIAYALDSESVGELIGCLTARSALNGRQKRLYAETPGVQLPEEYETLIYAVDRAAVLFRKGSCKESWLLCDSIVKAMENGTERELAKSLTETAGETG